MQPRISFARGAEVCSPHWRIHDLGRRRGNMTSRTSSRRFWVVLLWLALGTGCDDEPVSNNGDGSEDAVVDGNGDGGSDLGGVDVADLGGDDTSDAIDDLSTGDDVTVGEDATTDAGDVTI